MLRRYRTAEVGCSRCNNFFSKPKSKDKCFICGKFDNEYSSNGCKNHTICDNCLEFLQSNKALQINILNNCTFCSKKIKLNDEEKKFDVARLYNKAEEFCKVCGTRKIEFPELQSCYICSNKARIRLTCRRCNKKYPETYKTPTCIVHHYCENCLQQKVSLSSGYKLECSDCHKYFRFVNTDKTENAACNLCPSSETSDLSCKIHRYCKICCSFLKSNDYTKYPNIKNCLDCVKNLKSIKENQLHPSKVETYINTEHSLKTKINYPDTSPSGSTASVAITSELDRLNISANLPNSSTPSSHILVTNHDRRSSFDKQHNPYSAVVVLPQNSFQGSLIVQDRLINSFQYSTGDLFSSNYSYNLKSVGYCNNCNTEEAYTTFICKHNYCIECLLALACIRIYEFFCQYDNGQNPAVLKQKFFYKCKISGCQEKIMIPSKLVRCYLSITLSDRFTPKKVEYFMQMKSLYLRIFEILNEIRWMPYLDGIKSFLAF